MYKKRGNYKSSKLTSKENAIQKRSLNVIDENTTIKSQRLGVVSVNETKNLEEGSSEENIPASQVQTQRYLSQRSINAGTLLRTQSRSQRPPSTYYELILMNAGVQLDEADTFVLYCDNVSFVGKLREILIKSQNYPDNVETFKMGMLDALNVKSTLIWKMLGGCTISIPGLESVYQSQDSMIVNFLMVDLLREHVIDLLLNKIEETACNPDFTLLNQRKPLLTLLLTQLRYAPLTYGGLIFTRIKFIFERCSDFAKREIIANGDLILDSSKHDEFAQVILDHMPSKGIFDANAVQTLTNLCLSLKMQHKLRNKMLAFITDKQSPNMPLPQLIRFLLKALTQDTDECVRELITVLREILIWQTTDNPEVLDKQLQLELYNYIAQGLMRSRRFYDIWKKTIAVMPAKQFKSIDFLILLILINIKEDRALTIQSILRGLVILEHLKIDILLETKSRFGAILVVHTNILLQIVHDFLGDKKKSVANFARASYSILFEMGDSFQKNILGKLLELTLEKSSTNMANLALELIIDLKQKYPEKVQNWANLLMPLLDRVNEMSLSQARLVMGLLCSLAYPMPTLTEFPALQDQIDMLVKKQLINRASSVKKRGIIGSVQLVDKIARIDDAFIEIDDLNETFSAINDLPDGRGKIAAQYIVRVHSSTIHCPESLALFYVELASVCTSSPNDCSNTPLHDKPFLIWLCELMTYNLQNSFITEHTSESSSGISLSYQKCINSAVDANTEDNEITPIAINIGGLVLEPAADATSSMLVLAPLFNLVRVLHLQRYNGSLELINALLGCAIILPTFFDNPEDLWLDYDVELRKKILDIYFHCVNWIRETVSSFTTQREDMIRTKVLTRLSELIKIEEKIRKLLLKAPVDYVPPICQFISDSCASPFTANTWSGGCGRSIPNSNQDLHSRQSEMEVSFKETNANSNTKKKHKPPAVNNYFNTLYGSKEIYRQMDSNIMLILREKLITQYPLPKEENGKGIGLVEYRFVLNDLVSKLESVSGMQKCDKGATIQYIAKPLYFIMDLSKFLGVISRNMELLASAIFEKLENVKHAYGHADLFTDRFSFLKVNLGLSFHLLAIFFSWFDLVNMDNKTALLLKESLLSLFAKSVFQEFKDKRSCEIARKLFSMYKQSDANVVDLKTGVHLYQLLLALQKHSTVKDGNDESVTHNQSNDIRNFCKSLLMRQWYNYDGCIEKGSSCNIYLNELVKGFLKKSDFRRQREILRVLLDETKQLRNNESALKSFPNFKKANFHLLFRGLCEVLISFVSNVVVTDNEDAFDKLKIWEKSCEILNMLLEVLRGLEVSRNFQLFLKYSHMYLKLVLQYGLPVYEQFLRKNPERVNELLKSLQVTTRFLHNLCCHSKALKNTAIVGQIPFLRETVETLVFRVKALLVANKCASVFWMGNLKNKDIHGDELLSQSVFVNTACQDSDQDISDDMSVDETIFANDDGDSVRSFKDILNINHTKSSSRSKCF